VSPGGVLPDRLGTIPRPPQSGPRLLRDVDRGSKPPEGDSFGRGTVNCHANHPVAFGALKGLTVGVSGSYHPDVASSSGVRTWSVLCLSCALLSSCWFR
jgi:hypothetical protein